MATLILIVIYIGYIGLGIPDSLFGTAWPVMHLDFNLPVHIAGYLSPVFSVFTIISSVASTKVINRFGTGKVAAVSTALTVVGLFGNSLAPNIGWIIFFAIPLGFGAGAVDAGLNSYVALHYKAMHMNFLHCFYGIGVSISPFFMSKAIEKFGKWEIGYRNAGFAQLAVALIMIISLPLWRRVKHNGETEENTPSPRSVGLIELSKNPAVRAVWMCFFISCSIETLCGVWGSSFLADCKGFSADTAAMMITLYYAGLTLGRFLSGLLSIKLSAWKIIFYGLGVMGTAVVLFVLPIPEIFSCIGFFIIGLGIGPVYPNLMYLTPSSFGEDISQAVIGSQMAAAYTGIMIMPFVYGEIVKLAGLDSFPIYTAVLFIALIMFAVYLNRSVKKRNRGR